MKILKVQRGNFDEIYTHMLEAFPKNELKSYDTFKKLIADGQYDVLIATQDNMVGYALVYKVESTKSLWVDFIAILPEYQSKGFGTTFIHQVADFYKPNYQGIFLEVEIPDGIDQNKDRRIQYYTRLGAKILPCEYALPTYEGPFPMHLMYWGEAAKDIHVTVHEVFSYIHREIEGFEDILDKLV